MRISENAEMMEGGDGPKGMEGSWVSVDFGSR